MSPSFLNRFLVYGILSHPSAQLTSIHFFFNTPFSRFPQHTCLLAHLVIFYSFLNTSKLSHIYALSSARLNWFPIRSNLFTPHVYVVMLVSVALNFLFNIYRPTLGSIHRCQPKQRSYITFLFVARILVTSSTMAVSIETR